MRERVGGGGEQENNVKFGNIRYNVVYRRDDDRYTADSQ